MRVLIRVDGGGSLGVGHVMRSLALAEAAVAAGHDVVVAGHFEGSFVQGQLAAAPVEVVPLPAPAQAPRPGGGPDLFLELIQRLGPDVLHVDSYEWQGWPMGSMVPRAMILSNLEDGTFGRRPADVVIDPTLGAEHWPRPDDGSTMTHLAPLLLRGSRYVPIRQRVLDARRVVKPIGTIARSVLVVMGGTDPVGLAPAAVRLLARTGLPLDVTVIAVGAPADRARIAAAGSRVSLDVRPPVDDLPVLMARQHLVVSAAGTSVWELCALGVPMGVVWAVDNQRAGYERVVAAGAALGLGGPELGGGGLDEGWQGDGAGAGLLRNALTDARVRLGLSVAARKIVDGFGAWRVVRTWEQAVRQSQQQASVPDRPSATALVARPVTLDDARLLWEWRNDSDTRAGSRHADLVPWLKHLAWVGSSLARADRMLLVVEDEAGPVGTVRWDLEPGRETEGEWEVSITVAPRRRGQSLARPLLRAAEVARSSGTEVTAYLAVVHVDNHASVRLFETSGYVPDLPPDPRGFMRFRKAAPVA